MRISQEHVAIIKKVAHEIYGDADLWLFGSRVDDAKKGGDIDLFLETAQKATLEQKIKFLTKIERLGIERKVDLVVKSLGATPRTIFETAKKTGVKL